MPYQIDSANHAFVVSTGRCGSTTLSNILRLHQEVLSVSELFTSLGGRSAFTVGPIDGPNFERLITTPRAELTLLLRQGLSIPEILHRPTTAELREGVPPLLVTVLPHITSNYHQLHKLIRRTVRAFPLQSVERQYTQMLDFLADHFGRRGWVERSGRSTGIVDQLVTGWPDAKFVHFFRDGREVAMSMSNHHAFRLMMFARLKWPAPTRQNDLHTIVAQFDVDEYLSQRIPLPKFGLYWSQQVLTTLRILALLPPSQVLSLSYEELIEDSPRTMQRLSDHLEISLAKEWVGLVDRIVQRRPEAWRSLSPSEQARLTAACRPGLRALGYT